jgi:hypothetical protein
MVHRALGDLSVKVEPAGSANANAQGISVRKSGDGQTIHVVVESHNSKMDSFYGHSFDVVPTAGNQRRVLFAPLNTADLHELFRRISDRSTVSFPALPGPLTVHTDRPFEITLSAGDPPRPAEMVSLSWN